MYAIFWNPQFLFETATDKIHAKKFKQKKLCKNAVSILWQISKIEKQRIAQQLYNMEMHTYL